MKNVLLVSVALCAGVIGFTLFPTESSANSDKFRRSNAPVQNNYIVVFQDDVADLGDEHAIGNAVSRLASEYPGAVKHQFSNALKGYAAEMSEAEAIRLSRDPRVKYVEEDVVVELQATTQSNATWGISRTDQRGWVYPLDTNYSYGTSGRGVNVYVVDTGILLSHPDFEGRAFNGFDAYSYDTTPQDQCSGHGTHVAGTIGSRTYGMAKSARLFSVRVFPCSGSSSGAALLAGIDWITRNAVRPAVANLSLTSPPQQSLNDAVQGSINAGITYVAAAGNYSTDACNYSPAQIPDVITAGATDNRDYRSSISNFGRCVDLFAPGEAITSLRNELTYGTIIMSGTSTAAPHIAGAAAVYLESNPTATPRQVADYLAGVATPGILSDIGQNSPNLFLFSDPALTPGTGGGGEPPPSACGGNTFTGSLIATGSVDYKSSTSGFSVGGGAFSGTLTSPAGTQFRLNLEKKKGKSWNTVAGSSGTGTVQTVNFTGGSGTYRWKAFSSNGSGTYTLCSVTP